MHDVTKDNKAYNAREFYSNYFFEKDCVHSMRYLSISHVLRIKIDARYTRLAYENVR